MLTVAYRTELNNYFLENIIDTYMGTIQHLGNRSTMSITFADINLFNNTGSLIMEYLQRLNKINIDLGFQLGIYKNVKLTHYIPSFLIR